MALEDAAKLIGASVSSTTPISDLADTATSKVEIDAKAEKPNAIVEKGEDYKVTSPPEDWNDERLKAFFISVKTKAKDERAFKEQIRNEVWNLYNNQFDFSNKADWQAKEVLPKIFIMVESVAAFIQNGLLKLRDYFDVLPVNKRNPDNRIKAFIVKNLLKFYATDKKFIFELVEALKWGFLSELFIFKVWSGEEIKYTVEPIFGEKKYELRSVDEEELPTIRQRMVRRRRLMYSSVNPSYMYLDWTGREKLLIEEVKIDIADLESLVEEGLARDLTDKIKADSQQKIEDVREKFKKEQVSTPPSSYRREVTLHEYWGDVWDEEGKIIYENIHFIIANEKYIIVSPEPIQFYDGEAPYVIAPCIIVPGSVYHKSLIEPIIGVAKMMVELFDLTLDALFSLVMNIYEIDVDHVQNIGDLANGIGPNTVIQKTVPEKVLEVTQAGKIPGEAFAGIEFLNKILEENTAITKGLFGLPTTTKRQTKGEVESQTQFTVGFFQAMIQNIENNFIAPVLKKMWYRILQFQDDFSHPKLKDLIGEEAASMLERMSKEERYDVINGDYEFVVTGLSGLIAKREQLQNIITFTRIIGRSQEMMSYVDVKGFLSEVVDLLNIDATSILKDRPTPPPQLQGNGQKTQQQPGGGGMNAQQILAAIQQARMRGQGQQQAPQQVPAGGGSE